MKLIKGNLRKMSYPVGDEISRNMPIIKKLGAKIRTVIIRNKIEIKKINIFCSGSSGAIIAAIISETLIKKFGDVDIRHIKKCGENSHGFEYTTYGMRGFNIIVDDFIATGETMKRIFYSIEINTKIDLIAVTGEVNGHMIDFFNIKGVKYLISE